MGQGTLYAEDVNYWRTGKSFPDRWMDRARREIGKAGGTVLAEAYGSTSEGKAGFMLAFAIGADHFKMVWPVLPSKSGNERAAKIQAATMLYHDVKSRCVASRVLGARAAFFCYLVLPDGRTAAEATVPELTEGIPQIALNGADNEIA